MKKRFFVGLLALILCFCAVVPTFALAEMPRLVDEADLLTASEEAALLSLLDEISQRQDTDVVIVTADTLNGQSPRDYADDFYDYNGYRYDGILLLVSMEDRDWWISTCGYGITAVTDAGIDYLSDRFLPSLSDGEYAEAFEIFAQDCDELISRAKDGDPYDVGDEPKEPFKPVGTLLAALVVGLLVALVVTAVLKGQLKSIRAQDAAADYVNKDSLRLTTTKDLYLYSHTTRVEKPRDGGSSTHSSSSGRPHGGGGGKF